MTSILFAHACRMLSAMSISIITVTDTSAQSEYQNKVGHACFIA